MAQIITRPITFTPSVQSQAAQTRYLPSTAIQRQIAYTPPPQSTIVRQPGLTSPSSTTIAPARTLAPVDIEQRAQQAINRYPSAGFSNYIVQGGYWYGVKSADGMTMTTRLNPATADTYPNPTYQYSYGRTGTPTYSPGSAGNVTIGASARPEAPGPGSTKTQIAAYAESLASWEREQMWRQIPANATQQEIEDWYGEARFDLPTQERREYDIYRSMLPAGPTAKQQAIEAQYAQQKGTILSSSGILRPTGTETYSYVDDSGWYQEQGTRVTGWQNVTRGGVFAPTDVKPEVLGVAAQAVGGAVVPVVRVSQGMIGDIAYTKLGQDYFSRGTILSQPTEPRSQQNEPGKAAVIGTQIGTTQAPPEGFVGKGVFDEQSKAVYLFFKGLSDDWNKQVTEPISKSFKQPESTQIKESDPLSYVSFFASEWQKTQPWNYPVAASRGAAMTIEFPGIVTRGSDVLAANIGLFPALVGSGLLMQGEGVVQGLKERPQEFIIEQAAMLLTTHYAGKGIIKGVSHGSPIWSGVARIPTGEYIKTAPGLLSKGGIEPLYNTYALLYSKKPFSGTYSGGKTLLGFSVLRESTGPKAVVKLEGKIRKLNTEVTSSYRGVIGERGLLAQTKETPIAMQSGLDLERPPLSRTDFVVLRPTFKETALSPLQFEMWEAAYKAKDISTSRLYQPEVKGKIGDLPHAAFPTPAYRAMFEVVSSYKKDVVTYGSRVLNEIWVGKGYGRTAEPIGTVADVDLATYAKILPEYHSRMVAARDVYIKAPHGKFTFLKEGSQGQSQIEGTTPKYKGFGTHTIEEFGIFEEVKLYEVETAFGQKIWVPGPDYFLSAKSGGSFAGVIKPAKGKHAGKMTLVINRAKDIPDVYSLSRSMAESMYSPVKYDVGGVLQARKTKGAKILEDYSEYVKRFAEEELPKISDKETTRDVSARFREIQYDILKGVERQPKAEFDVLRDIPSWGGRADRETAMLFPPRQRVAEMIPVRRTGYRPVKSIYLSQERKSGRMIAPSILAAQDYRAYRTAEGDEYNPYAPVDKEYSEYSRSQISNRDYLGSVLEKPYGGYGSTPKKPESPYTSPYQDTTYKTPYRATPTKTPYAGGKTTTTPYTSTRETPYTGGKTTTTPYTSTRETPYTGGKTSTTPYTSRQETPYTGIITTTTPYRAPKEVPYTPFRTPIPLIPPKVPIITRPVLLTRTKKRKKEEYPGKLNRVWPEFFPYAQHAPVISPTSMLKGVLSGKKLKPVRS